MRGRLSSNQCFFPPRAPWGFALSDLKWRPAAQTWMLWLHIKPFNHRAPCSIKKPLMRSLPRMNKQALMRNPEHFFLCEGYGKQEESWVSSNCVFSSCRQAKEVTEAPRLMCCRETFQLEGCKIFRFHLIYPMIVRLGALWGRCKSFCCATQS